MIHTYDYYSKNIKQDNFYYFAFNDIIESSFAFIDDYNYFDDEDLINEFKKMTYPSNEYTEAANVEFILMCFYLNDQGYCIKQFPNYLERPNNIENFSLEIRKRILSQHKKDGDGANYVSWEERREFSELLVFTKSDGLDIAISEELKGLFKKVSNRNADFLTMTANEKLAEINNVLENILKLNDKWNDIDLEIKSFDFLSDNSLTKYRKLIQCFRHGAESSIGERKLFTERQKSFLINYGITVCELASDIMKMKDRE